jgi:hypothetical protein
MNNSRHDVLCKDAMIIIAVCLISSIVLIANPGYFNHDELQKIDFIRDFGLGEYIRSFASMSRGADFGEPVRPVSFLVQGLIALPMYDFPVLTHFLDSLMHAVVAVTLYLLLIALSTPRTTALLAAIFFGWSPLVSFSVGWPGALMERLYVFFGLLTALLALSILRLKRQWPWMFAAAIASGFAVLSKETALILPVLVIVLLLYCRKDEEDDYWGKRSFGILIAVSAPVVLYLVYRAPAIAASALGAGVPHYRVSSENLITNCVLYFAYPFLLTLTEAVNIVFVDQLWIVIAAGVHALLIVLVGHYCRWKKSVLYICAFGIPLLPVVLISGKGSHYLYASAAPLSTGIAALWVTACRRRAVLLIVGMTAVTVALTVHSAVNQRHIYTVGRCMDRALTSLEAKYISSSRPSTVVFDIDPLAPGHIIGRIITGRNHIGRYHPIGFFLAENYVGDRAKALNVRFSSSCLVY